VPEAAGGAVRVLLAAGACAAREAGAAVPWAAVAVVGAVLTRSWGALTPGRAGAGVRAVTGAVGSRLSRSWHPDSNAHTPTIPIHAQRHPIRDLPMWENWFLSAPHCKQRAQA
jgi:hypothetical protein